MPPAMSDDESDNMPDQIPAKKSTKPDPEEEEEDEEEDEDEYQVEEILEHQGKGKKLMYKVKWLGWEKEEDMTWEPVSNLENAVEALERYHAKIGGDPQGASAKKGKGGKRSASAAFDSPAPTSSSKKKGRKSETNGDAWEPPLGLWEEQVTRVAAIVEEEPKPGVIKKGNTDVQSLEGLIEWTNGRKTQHKMSLLRTKCPQRLLDYYENHLVFKGDPRWVQG